LSKKLAGIFTLNLEENLPRVDEALMLFDRALDELAKTAIRVVKVIHGYGSGGQGGRIKEAIRQELIYQSRSH
jgi:dsDNA-specific endonuclease/ATPase MutS2